MIIIIFNVFFLNNRKNKNAKYFKVIFKDMKNIKKKVKESEKFQINSNITVHDVNAMIAMKGGYDFMYNAA